MDKTAVFMVVTLGAIGIALVFTHTNGGMLNGVIGAISGLAGIQAGYGISRARYHDIDKSNTKNSNSGKSDYMVN